MAKYSNMELRRMAREVIRIRRDRNPVEMHDLMTFMVVMSAKTGLQQGEIWKRIEYYAGLPDDDKGT